MADLDLIIGNDDTVQVDCSFWVRSKGKDKRIKFFVEFERLSRSDAINLANGLSDSIDRRQEIVEELQEDGCDKISLRAEADKESEYHASQIKSKMRGWELGGNGGEQIPFDADYIEAIMENIAYFKALSSGLFMATGECQKRNSKN